jgi:hypothetical protein
VFGEADESPLLVAITRAQLVKTKQTEDLVCAVEICKMWKSAMAL